MAGVSCERQREVDRYFRINRKLSHLHKSLTKIISIIPIIVWEAIADYLELEYKQELQNEWIYFTVSMKK
jgi:hypothetical protein